MDTPLAIRHNWYRPPRIWEGAIEAWQPVDMSTEFMPLLKTANGYAKLTYLSWGMGNNEKPGGGALCPDCDAGAGFKQFTRFFLIHQDGRYCRVNREDAKRLLNTPEAWVKPWAVS